MSSRIGGGFDEGILVDVLLFVARAELTISSRGGIPKCDGSGSCCSRTSCRIWRDGGG